MSGPVLERRYRRLLAWYPWSHRRMYEEEMLAVLVAGARPGQRWPTLGEAANLIGSGLRARVRVAVAGLARPAWVDAAAVFGLLAAVVLLSQRVVRLIERVGLAGAGPDPTQYSLRAAGWGAVVLAVLAGLRLLAATLAWVMVLGEAVLLAGQYGTDPTSAIHLLWPLALGIAAAAALTVPAPRWRAAAVLRAPRLLGFGLGLGLVQAITLASRNQDGPGVAAGVWYVNFGLENRSEAVLNLWLAAIALGAVAAGLSVLSLPAAVRWRIAALVAPVATLAAMIQVTQGWTDSNGYMGQPVYLVLARWTLLVAPPLVVAGLGAALVQRRDQVTRAGHLGRAADRERLDS